MAVQLCGVDGCKNPIKAGAPGCWRHPDGSSTRSDGGNKGTGVSGLDDQARKASLDAGLGMYGESIYVPHSSLLTEEGFQINLVTDNTDIAPDIAPFAIGAVTEMEDVHSLDVPSYVTSRLAALVTEFQERMIANGADRSRISTLRMTGLHRRTLRGRIQDAPEVSHIVTVLDRDQPHQVVIDPFVATMTPVRDPNASILDQYDSPSSPLADIPMIAPIRDYVYGDYLWFDKLAWVEPAQVNR